MSAERPALEEQVADLARQLEELRREHAATREELSNLRLDLVTEVALSEKYLATERAAVLTAVDAVAHAVAKQASSPEAFASALRSFVLGRYLRVHRADWVAFHLIGLVDDLRSAYGQAAPARPRAEP